MSEVFSVRVPYAIKYTTINPVPIAEIVDSLQNLERLIKRTPIFFEMAYKGVKVLETKVYVEKIESGSLYQKFVVEYFFNGGENYEEAKALAARICKESKPMKTLLAVGVGGLITFGVLQAIPSGQPTEHIEAYNSVIIQAGNDINLTPDAVIASLNKISDKKALAKEAVAVIRPAKGDNDAVIEIEGLPNLTMPASAISEVPGDYQPAVPEERTVHYDAATVFISASDRDKSSSGWAGTLPGITDSRKPFVLNDDINPAEVHGKTRVNANIAVHERYVKSKKEYQVHSVEILKILP